MNNYNFKYSTPSKSLSGAVKGFWMISGKGGVNDLINTKLIPCSGFGIISILNGRFFHKDETNGLRSYPKSFLLGVRTKGYEVNICGEYGLFGIIFHPEIYQSLHLTSSRDLVDNKISLLNVFGKTAKNFEEELFLAATFTEKTKVASRYLERHFLSGQKSPDENFKFLIKCIHSHLYLKSVEEISEMCSMSTRNFNRKFIHMVGINPKKYNRIIRFQKIINLFNLSKSYPNLTALAYEFGYADQSHFIKDFSKLSGNTPLKFKSNLLLGPNKELVQKLTENMKNADLIHT